MGFELPAIVTPSPSEWGECGRKCLTSQAARPYIFATVGIVSPRRLCFVCAQRLASIGGRCDTCYGYFCRTGKDRPVELTDQQRARDALGVLKALGYDIDPPMAEGEYRPSPEHIRGQTEALIAQRKRAMSSAERQAFAEAMELRTAAPSALVYFFQRRADGRIKIGVSVDVATRQKDLETGAGPVQLVGLEMGGFARERQLHKKFAAEREHGEWFFPSERLLGYLNERYDEALRILRIEEEGAQTPA